MERGKKTSEKSCVTQTASFKKNLTFNSSQYSNQNTTDGLIKKHFRGTVLLMSLNVISSRRYSELVDISEQFQSKEQNIHFFRPKWLKCIPQLGPKWCEDHELGAFRHTNIVPPPPAGICCFALVKKYDYYEIGKLKYFIPSKKFNLWLSHK